MPSTDTLIRLAELLLNKNTFSFSNEVFSLVSGVAMDTKMGPSYACIFVEYLLLQQYNKPVPEFYKRYTNDIIGTTSINCNQRLGFINFVHNFHPSVKCTYQLSETSVSFLDLNISFIETGNALNIHSL